MGINPAATIVSGDLSINGPDSDDELAFAAAALGSLPGQTVSLPGNHDIGDEPPGQDARQIIDDARLARWDRLVGPDRWCLDFEHWAVLGLNSQLLGSGLARENEQNDWLDHELRRASGKNIALILHKPLFLESALESDANPSCTVPSARRPLLDRFQRGGVKLVISGHLHLHRDRNIDGIQYIWAPSTAFIGGENLGGRAICGFLLIELAERNATVELLRPAGLVDINLQTLKQNGRYAFLRDMPPCRPDTSAILQQRQI